MAWEPTSRSRAGEGIELIGLAGFKESGKDEAAKTLIELGFKKIAFADPLRQEVSIVIGDCYIPSDVTDPNIIRIIRQLHAQPFPQDQPYIKPTPPAVRYLLQWWGTDYRRRLYGESYWVDRFQASLVGEKKVVVTDVRFPDEVEAIRRNGGQVWVVRRPSVVPVGDVHASEQLPRHDDSYFDAVIDNSGTLQQLKKQVEMAYGLRFLQAA